MKLLFLGSPGVGKGTYAQVLTKVLGIPHISSGDLLRAEISNGTPYGKQIEQTIAAGGFASDDDMLRLIEQRITQPDCKDGFILDGFPRTTNQAEQLKELCEITHVLNFKADDEVIIERLGGRLTCSKCSTIFHKTGNIPKKEGICDHCDIPLSQREDDKPTAIQKRLDLYRVKTKPLVDHYEGEGLLVEVVINKPISEIRKQLVEKVTAFLEGKTDSIGTIE